MYSVADRLRTESRKELSHRTAAERVVLALALGARDLSLFADAQVPPLDRHVAAHILERRRQAGRRRCGCLEELIG